MDLELPPCLLLDAASGEPPEIVLDAMRRHRVEVHGLGFKPGRDVAYAGHNPPRATLTYVPPTVKAVIWDFVQLAQRDPKRYREVTGGTRVVGYETARRYWKQIPAHERAAARRRFDALPETEQRRIRKALRLAK